MVVSDFIRQPGEQLFPGLVRNALAAGMGQRHQVLGSEGRFGAVGGAGAVVSAVFRQVA